MSKVKRVDAKDVILLNKIKSLINTYNALYATNQNGLQFLRLYSDIERRIEATEVYQYCEQFTGDICAIVLSQHFDFTPDQLKDFATEFKDALRQVRNEKEDESLEDREMWYSNEMVERMLRDAWGEYYVEKNERYSFEFKIHGLNGIHVVDGDKLEQIVKRALDGALSTNIGHVYGEWTDKDLKDAGVVLEDEN